MWTCIKATLQIELCNRFDSEIGLIIYKSILTFVLIKICNNCVHLDITDELKLQTIKKLASRVHKLNKISRAESTNKKDLEREGLNELVKFVFSESKLAIQQINQVLKMKLDESIHKVNDVLIDMTKFCNNDHIYNLFEAKNSIDLLMGQKLTKSIQITKMPIKERNLSEEIPRLELISKSNIDLNDIENWVLYSKILSTITRVSTLFGLLDKYVELAKDFYKNDPVGYSRMVLASIKLICAIDKIACDKHALLKKYSIGFKSDILEILLLPNLNEMLIAKELSEYINQRNQSSCYANSVFDESYCSNSFSVQYAIKNEEINRIKSVILNEASLKRENKIKEVQKKRKEYYILKDCINSMKCKCNIYLSMCSKCNLHKSVENMKVDIYEWPLPKIHENENSLYTVLFELCMPQNICKLRDSLYILNEFILKTEHNSKNQTSCHALWINYLELNKYLKIRPKYVTLGSTTKLFSNSHYRSNHPKMKDEDFVPLNGYNICMSVIDKRVVDFNYNEYKYKSFCTMKVSFPYCNLQFALNDTSHKENQVIAEQINCPQELKQAEFINFGCFRSGHCLQMRNLLNSLTTKNISFNSLSVSSLISQSLWEIGKIDFESNVLFNVPSSHYDLKNVVFLDQLYLQLDEFLNGIEKKWNDSLVMYNLIIILLRVISLIQNEELEYICILNKMITLLRRCRNYSNQWEDILKEVICKENEPEKKKSLKLELAKICLYSISTFNVYGIAQALVMNQPDDAVSWLCSFDAIARIKNMCKSNSDSFLENLFRRADLTATSMADQYLKVVNLNNGEAFTKFVLKIWPDAKLGNINYWKLDSENVHPYWYLSTFKRIDDPSKESLLHINILGEFLINYYPMGKLPKSILEHKEFQRFFGYSDFDVQPASEGIGSFVTSIRVKNDSNLTYTFFEVKKCLITIERTNCNESWLIPKEIFEDYLPSIFLNNYSHWFNKSNNKIEFRIKSFTLDYVKELFKDENSFRFTLNLSDSTLTDNLNEKFLIHNRSKTFDEIYQKLAIRLEDYDYVHVFKSKNDQSYLDIQFPRLKLNFKLNKSKNEIWSEEHSTFKVSSCQKLETLIGLQSLLVLIEDNDYPIKKLLIPHGKIIKSDTKKVTIEYEEAKKPSCFSYIIDENFHSIKAEDSNTAWLFLALLHAFTSQILCDPFTNMTGTDMALYLLKSGNCWSCKELSEESKDILNEFKSLSPKRKFYPKGMKIMQNVQFPKNIPALCASEEFHTITQQLSDDSKRLNFACQQDCTVEKKVTYTDPVLSKKAYLRNSKFFFKSEISFDSLTTHSIDNEIIYNKEVRKISTQSYSSNNFDLVSFIFNSQCKFDLSKDNFFKKSYLQTVLNCFQTESSNEFTTYWYDLYDFSRTEPNSIKLDLILSYLAYKNINLEYLLIFQKISSNSASFKMLTPPLVNYNLGNSYRFNSKLIKCILEKNYISFNEHISIFPKDGYTDYENKKQTEIMKIISQYSKHENDMIPSNSYIWIDLSKFSIDPCKEIEQLFASWLNNRKLCEFLQAVQSIIIFLSIPKEFQLIELRKSENYKKKILTLTKIFLVLRNKILTKSCQNMIFVQKSVEQRVLISISRINWYANNMKLLNMFDLKY